MLFNDLYQNLVYGVITPDQVKTLSTQLENTPTLEWHDVKNAVSKNTYFLSEDDTLSAMCTVLKHTNFTGLSLDRA